MADVEQSTTPPALSDNPPSYEELMARARAGLGKQKEGTPSPQPPEHPVQGFWDRLLNGVKGKSRTGEMARSIGRGALNAITETGDTIAEGAAYVDRKTGLGEKLTPGFNAAYDEGKLANGTFTQNADGENISDHYLGKRSDDPLASFAESATQFTTGFLAGGELKLAQGATKLGALKGVAHVLGGLARGAAIDATMFDPYEAQLAELAAKAPVPILKQVGQLLSVKEDDGALVARIKRATAGLVPAATIEGLIAGTRALRAAKTVVSATATDAEKATAHASLEEQTTTLKAIDDGTHVPEGAHVTVKPTDNGQFTIEKVGDVSPLEGVQGQRLEFPDRAEAEMQAESMNMGLNARETVGQVDEGSVALLTNSLESPEAVKALAADPDQINGLSGSYHNTVEDDAKLVGELSQKIHDALPGIRQGDNTLADADVKELASQMLGYVPENKAYDVVGSLLKGDTQIQSVSKVMAEMVAGAKGRQLAKMSEMVDARPHDPVLVQESVQAVQNYFDFLHHFGMVESDAARMLRLAQQRSEIRAAEVTFADETAKVAKGTSEEAAGATSGGEKVPLQEKPPVAGMATRDASPRAVDAANVAATLRMIKMAGGEPRNANAIIRSTAIQWNQSIGARVYEFFANSLLSGIKTMETIAGSGIGVSTFEPIVRMAAGVATGNRALAREGADMLYGNFAYLKENIQSATMAFRLGRSIIDPIPPRYATGGLAGTIIRTPGRTVGMLDELLTATNYRSYVRAKSLRVAREQGLEGAALDARVADDLKAAFDPQTGIATIPEALKYAEVPSFKQPLGGGFGKAWQEMAQDNLTVRFITPFVKAPVNIWRYTLDSTPLLNMVAKRNRDILVAGGEEAAILHTRSAFATAMYGFGLYQAQAGNLTGRGPSDPELRKMWLKDHQEYSLKIGDKWISYRRMDPFGLPLGLIADTHTFISELGDKDVDAEHYGAAVAASIGQNMVSRSYMSGLSEFMSAFGEGNASKTMRYAQGFLGNVVPQGVAALNPDPYYREMRSVMDGAISRVPGWSETLPPRYNAFGEKMLKTEGTLNRGANMFTVKDATPTVEDKLVDLKRALPPFSQKLEGHIDLTDKAFGDSKQPSPYERLMSLVSSPNDGRKGLREAMEDLVKTPKWEQASSGAAMFPGGARWILASTLKESYEQKALKTVLQEYPKLRTQYEAVARMKGAAVISGESGVQQVESLFGVSRNAH